MSKKKLFQVVCICLLLTSIVVLVSFVKHNFLPDKNESDNEKESGNTFFIHNWGNKSHEVTVELLNSKNISIFNESYISAPKKDMKSQFPITLTPGTYIKVTLDSNITKTQMISGDSSDIVLYIDIDIRPDDPLDLDIAIP
jgi:hypothetical protein